MKKVFFIALCCILCLVSCSKATASADKATRDYYYSYGNYVAQNLELSEPGCDLASFVKGIQDYMKGKTLTPDEMQKIIDAYMGSAYEGNLKEAEAFLAENAKKEGVKTIKKGLQIKFSVEGKGEKPDKDDEVRLDYVLTNLAGEILDGNDNIEFDLENMIPGFRDAVCEMREGSTATFWIHPDLGYGVQGSRSVEPNSLLIFEVTLHEVD